MRKLSILFLTFVLCVSLASASVTVTQNAPANYSYDTDGSVTFNFTVEGNVSLYDCNLYTDDDGTWTNRATNSNIANDTPNTDFTRTGLSDVTFLWNVYCEDVANSGNNGWDSTNDTLIVDNSTPSVTVNYPGNGTWDKDGRVIWNLTVYEDHADTCLFQTVLNQTTNTTDGTFETRESKAYTNNTYFELGFGNQTALFLDNGTGLYEWNYVCNDSTGRTVSSGTNLTLFVDQTAPSAFIFLTADWKTDNRLTLSNASISTDYTPQIGWQFTGESNFVRYRVRFYNTTGGGGAFIEKNFTTQGGLTANLTTNMSSLTADKDFYIFIEAFDRAGWSTNMTVDNYKYSTISQGRSLLVGWNVQMNQGSALSLSQLLNFTGATTLSYFNGSHQFTSHVSGGSYGDITVPYGEAYFAYMGSAGTFSDMVRDTSQGNARFNLSNQTATAWNIACNRNTSTGYTFREMDTYLNGNSSIVLTSNVTYFSYYNNSADTNYKYVPFVANTTYNNGTTVSYGQCSWFYLPGASKRIEVDWLNI